MRKIIFTWVVVVAIVLPIFALIFYTLPKINSMYISSDTYNRENKSNQDGKTGVKVISKVEQSENGIYFVYKGRLMYMENSDGNINEICKIPSEIVGILEKDNTVFLRECDNVASIYKVNANGEIVKIANDSGKMYMEGENIYTLNVRHGLRKYDFSGKMIFSNKEALDFTTSHTIFDDYIFYKWYQNERIALSVPQYYRLDVNKIKYLLHEVKFSRYYLEPEEWDSYNRENVIENFHIIGQALGGQAGDFVLTQQTHSINVRRVGKEDRGRGIFREREYTDVDALITNEEDVILTAFSADCVPILFYDKGHRAIASCHSGWRGTHGRILAQVIKAMEEEFSSKPEEIYIAIGPSICKNCYEVSEDVGEAFLDAFPALREMTKNASPIERVSEEKFHIDLWELNRIIALECFIPPENISISGYCTMENPDLFFSHRFSQGKRGVQGSFICLKSQK